jgi:hypothetical protein
MDCFENGINEIHCFDWEINECEKNEYRCHNGMCVPEQFFNDNILNPDCLDVTDENDNEIAHLECYSLIWCAEDPAFRCEESRPFRLVRSSACGDGQEMYFTPKELEPSHDPIIFGSFPCIKQRYQILFDSTLLGTKHSHFSSDYWLLLICATLGMLPKCAAWLYYPKYLPIHSKCNYSSFVILAFLPVL